MDFGSKQQHAKHVEDWIERTGKGYGAKELGQLFTQAVQMLWQRSQLTLNEITLAAIFDRALCNSQEEFSVLSMLKIDSTGICLDGFMQEISHYSSSEITQAFRCLLIEVITIMGNLTGDILTLPLYNELSKVRLQNNAVDSKHQHQSTDI